MSPDQQNSTGINPSNNAVTPPAQPGTNITPDNLVTPSMKAEPAPDLVNSQPLGTSASPAVTPAPAPLPNLSSSPDLSPAQPTTSPLGGMVTPSTGSQPPSQGNRKKKFLIGGIAAFVVLAGIASFFLVYLPNTPNNVWDTGLSRSGKALSKVTESATDIENIEKITKTQIESSIEGEFSGLKFNGSLDSKFDDTKSDNSLKFKASAEGKDIDLGLNVLADLPKGSKFPNIYFQFFGLKALGLEESSPEITAYENKWISIENSFFEKYIPAEELSDLNNEQATAQEVAQLAEAISGVNNKYIFTSDESKAVLVQKQFVAKEDVDGIRAYHYVVGINASNAKTYCKELVNTVMSQTATKKVFGEAATTDQIKKEAVKSCDEIKQTDDTFDMWVDAKYKLIYKAKFVDKKNKKSYVEIGQNYKGGDDVNFFANFNDDDTRSLVKLNISSNIKTNETNGSLSAESTSTESAFKVKAELKAKPYDGTVNASKPKGSVSIEEFLNALGLDPSTLTPDAPSDPSLTVQGVQTPESASSTDFFEDFMSAINDL